MMHENNKSLFERLVDLLDTNFGYVYEEKAEDVAERIINSGIFDVRPVGRGKWETVMLDHERMGCRPTAHYCSECHQITWFRTFFCPNCGADMREDGHA